MRRRLARRQVKRLITVVAAVLAVSTAGLGQTAPGKRSLTFHGKVEAINRGAKSLTVNGEKVDGWMDSMSMEYKVDNPAILTKAKPGDQIAAMVYPGNMVLHKVMITPKVKSQ